MDNEYFNEQASMNVPPQQTENNSIKKNKKKPGIVNKAAGLVASAAVFGLVAGTVIEGVDYVNDRYINPTQASTEVKNTNVATQTSTNGTVNTTYDVSTVAKNVMPAIVSITNVSMQTYSTWFDNYKQEVTGSGSGFIISQDDDKLLVVTNYHVIEGAKELTVGFINDEAATATVKGYDSSADLAVLEINTKDLSEETLSSIAIATLGDSSAVEVGQPAIAIGNALGYGQSVTVGYISAVNREVNLEDKTMTLLQTDAAINPGNSGGALLNMNGEVIGINTVKYVDSTVEGMGYSIPISDAIPIINDLVNAETIDEKDQAYLGIQGKDITAEYAENLNMPEGVYVAIVGQDTPAEESGLIAGDIITGFDDRKVSTMKDLQNIISAKKAGTEITLTVQRKDNNGNYQETTLAVTLGRKSDY